MPNRTALATGALALLAAVAAGCHFCLNDNLNQAARGGDVGRCQVLVSKGAKVNGAGMHDMKPIMSAAGSGSLETVRYLVSQGADVNAHNDSGSALMWAVDSGNEELVRFLLTQGAEFGWTNALGRGALDIAAEHRSTNLARILQTWTNRTELKAGTNGVTRKY